jgi:hypothetical protein
MLNTAGIMAPGRCHPSYRRDHHQHQLSNSRSVHSFPLLNRSH